MRDRSDFGPFLFLSVMAGVSIVAALAGPQPDPENPQMAGEAGKAWAARLEQEFGPGMGGCIWSRVSLRMEPARLDPILERANGDHRLYPALNQIVESARERCRTNVPLVAVAH